MAQLTLCPAEERMPYQLRTALTMEADTLAALGELTKAAESKDVKDIFRHHADEPSEQIDNLSAYHGLIVPTTAMGAGEVVTRLQANLYQEVRTSEELQSMLQKVLPG
jgi:ferritin-like metal-binding protein YciE